MSHVKKFAVQGNLAFAVAVNIRSDISGKKQFPPSDEEEEEGCPLSKGHEFNKYSKAPFHGENSIHLFCMQMSHEFNPPDSHTENVHRCKLI